MIGRLVRRTRRGAMAMVAVAAMVPVSGMISSNMNASQMVDDRRQTQDAADALAALHGTWTARSLNIISMNNVTTAQLMSVAVGSEALLFTTNYLAMKASLMVGHVTAHGAAQCPPKSKNPIAAGIEAILWTAPCTAWHAGIALPAVHAGLRMVDINKDFDPAHGVDVATRALKAIDGMNRALVARHPEAMAEIARGYHTLLEIDAHHFADPCNGAGLRQCRRTNTDFGMALPLDPQDFEQLVRLGQVMETGSLGIDTTFRKRGFAMGKGPLSDGGRGRHRHLREFINAITGIGDDLYEFRRFYDRSISDMPRHPLNGPGTAIGAQPDAPGQPEDEEVPFDDDTKDILDGLVDAVGGAKEVTEAVLKVLRKIPIGYDRISPGFKIERNQNRRGPNSFTRAFTVAHLSVAAGANREKIPVGIDLKFDGGQLVIMAAPVPHMFALKDMTLADMGGSLGDIESVGDIASVAFPADVDAMTDPYRILAYSRKAKSRRLGAAVLPESVTAHTGYGQVGVFNPDGATLYSQNWMSVLMPATRLDDPRGAARALDREATGVFDELAEDLLSVGDVASWGRVHAH
ncbi:hypothetical protein GQ651_17950 [Alphaproteobacteria bacterium GH1-50]|uniref:Uncharacterized protein n=1 Tax=Kangsaoukella pontilimi TaxID=2691042 RepID=A0A7C9MCW2_9RHOB|nr:hypothetical protein [Kangsaoukella pontilimi]MXQ09733.1 hypothetical protein [Kangsaoukella pontilimi]